MKDIDRLWLVDDEYTNPDVNVYIGDLHAIIKDEGSECREKAWARGTLVNFVKGFLKREDFLLICRRLDNI